MKQKMSHHKSNPQLFLFFSLLEIALKFHSVSCSSLCVCILFTKQFKSVQTGQLLKLVLELQQSKCCERRAGSTSALRNYLPRACVICIAFWHSCFVSLHRAKRQIVDG